MIEPTERPDESSLLANKYCPICGDTMHELIILDHAYWECDDPDCGFIEPK